MNIKLKCCICGIEQEKSILSHVRQEHYMSAKEYRDKFNSPLRLFAGKLDQVRELGKKNSLLLSGKPSHAKLPNNKWSREYDKCIQCGTTERKHIAYGLCKRCRGKNNMKLIIKKANAVLFSNGKENQDYVICKICNAPFQSLTTNGHLKMHNISDQEYKERFPYSKMYCKNTTAARSIGVSNGRKKLMAERGYLNPPSQRLSKSKEMAKRHSTSDFSKVSKIEDTVSNCLASSGYSIVWSNYIGAMDENTIVRQYLFYDCYCVDFACPSRKIIIEVLGDWWHGWEVIIGNQKKEDQHPEVQKNMRLDINRFRYIEHKGWTLIKIWEHDIKNGNFKNILRQYFSKINEA
jgi:very-short-patch-repair endonuclease/predicted transcriptional regulator